MSVKCHLVKVRQLLKTGNRSLFYCGRRWAFVRGADYCTDDPEETTCKTCLIAYKATNG